MSSLDQRTEMEVRDRDAAGYESWYLKKGELYQRIELEAIKRSLALTHDDVVLDAGCGTGRVARALSGLCAKVIAVDFSSKSIDVLRDACRTAGIANVESSVGDVKHPFRISSRVDKAVSVQVIMLIPTDEERVRALVNIRESMRKGGLVAATLYNWDSHSFKRGREREGLFPSGVYYRRFTACEARDLFVRAGFVDIKVNGIVNLKGYQRNLIAGRLIAYIDLMISRFTFSRRMGDFLLVTGINP